MLSYFVSWLGKEGFCDEGLAHKIKLPKATNKQVDILSEEEIRIIINTLKAKKTNHYRDLAIFTTFIETGVRLSEMVNLRISNIHFEQGILKVLGKGNKERYVHFGSNVQRNLMKYLQYERLTPTIKTDMLFLKDDGEPIQNTTIVNLFRRLKNATGIEKLHVHLCRHTMVTMRLANGENAFMVKAQTGHSSFDIMNNYFHMAETIKNSRKNNSLIDSMKL